MKKLILILIPVIVFSACTNTEPQQEMNSDTILDDEIFEQAINNQDLTACEPIVDENKKQDCKEAVEALILTDKAYDRADKSICKEIKLDRYKENCERVVSDLLEQQDSEEKMQKEKAEQNEIRIAIEQEAIDKGDHKICEQIEGEQHILSCKYNILANKAYELNDPNLCDEIGDDYMTKDCRDYVNDR